MPSHTLFAFIGKWIIYTVQEMIRVNSICGGFKSGGKINR